MKISANTAVKSQLSTLPQRDQDYVMSMLSSLPANLAGSDHVKRIPGDDALYEIRVTSRLRALVRFKKDQNQVELLAIARPDQIERYISVKRAV